MLIQYFWSKSQAQPAILYEAERKLQKRQNERKNAEE